MAPGAPRFEKRSSAEVFSVVCVFLISALYTALGHPQCLDFRPPFQASDGLSFCSEYSEFTCCASADDSLILKSYSEIIRQHNISSQCAGKLKDLLCLQCSPYAAHIYDGEANTLARTFPGLCLNYCDTFYTECRDIVQHISSDLGVLRSMSSAEAFCTHVSLRDTVYCFPELLKNQILNENITNTRVTSEGCLCLEEFAGDLQNPLILQNANDDSRRVFIAEQKGIVHVFQPDKTEFEEPFLDIQSFVKTSQRKGDERGLLGFAFHPKFTENRKCYVYYSTYNGKNESQNHKSRLSELLVSNENPNKIDQSYHRIILEIQEPFSNHNGGEILFGEDGYLYIFVGDGGSAGDPWGNGQNRSTLLGKVLRIDVNTGRVNIPYYIPRDNPFVGRNDTRPEIYALGVRNIWRCGKDRGDPDTGYGRGRMICGDVGQSAFEEIDIIKPGANYGWNIREGFECFKSDTCNVTGGEELPIFAYPHSVGKSITGGHIYRGCDNPNLNGMYIYGDYMTGRLFRLKEDFLTGEWKNKELFMCGPDKCLNGLTGRYEPNILSFGEDEDGEVYMLTTSYPSPTSRKGKVYKIVDPNKRGDPDVCAARRRGRHVNPTSPSIHIPAAVTPTGTVGINVDTLSPQTGSFVSAETPDPTFQSQQGTGSVHTFSNQQGNTADPTFHTHPKESPFSSRPGHETDQTFSTKLISDPPFPTQNTGSLPIDGEEDESDSHLQTTTLPSTPVDQTNSFSRPVSEVNQGGNQKTVINQKFQPTIPATVSTKPPVSLKVDIFHPPSNSPNVATTPARRPVTRRRPIIQQAPTTRLNRGKRCRKGNRKRCRAKKAKRRMKRQFWKFSKIIRKTPSMRINALT